MISAFRYSLFIFSIALLDVTSSFKGKYKYYSAAEGWIKGHPIPLNFQDAMIRCHLEGAVLASPLTAGMHNVIITELMSSISIPKAYTGINALHNDKYFSTVEGIPFEDVTYYLKDYDELRLNNGKHCFVHDNNGYLERVSCDERYPYLCYIKKEGEYVNECGTFVNNYVKFEATGKCYKYHAMKTDYKNAYLTCQAQNAHLITLNDEYISRAVKYVKNFTRFLAQAAENSGNIYEEAFKDDLYLGYRVLGSWFRRPISDQGELLEDSRFDLWNDTSDAPYCAVLTPNLTMAYVKCTERFPFICVKDPLDKQYV